jgi:hypothetical protein
LLFFGGSLYAFVSEGGLGKSKDLRLSLQLLTQSKATSFRPKLVHGFILNNAVEKSASLPQPLPPRICRPAPQTLPKHPMHRLLRLRQHSLPQHLPQIHLNRRRK